VDLLSWIKNLFVRAPKFKYPKCPLPSKEEVQEAFKNMRVVELSKRKPLATTAQESFNSFTRSYAEYLKGYAERARHINRSLLTNINQEEIPLDLILQPPMSEEDWQANYSVSDTFMESLTQKEKAH